MNTLGWTPQHGDTVHLVSRNPWSLPAGRYQLTRDHAGQWQLTGITVTGGMPCSTIQLMGADCDSTLTPISAAELAREAEEVRLRAAAPLRQARRSAWRPQHDASDLALFRAADESRLAL